MRFGRRHREEDARAWRALGAELTVIAASAEGQVLREKIEGLAERVRYSDPGSCREVEELERALRDNTVLLKQEVAAAPEQAEKRVEKLGLLLLERNEKLRLAK